LELSQHSTNPQTNQPDCTVFVVGELNDAVDVITAEHRLLHSAQ